MPIHSMIGRWWLMSWRISVGSWRRRMWLLLISLLRRSRHLLSCWRRSSSLFFVLLNVDPWLGSIRITFAHPVNLLDYFQLVFIDVVSDATLPSFGILVPIQEMGPLHLQTTVDAFQVERFGRIFQQIVNENAVVVGWSLKVFLLQILKFWILWRFRTVHSSSFCWRGVIHGSLTVILPFRCHVICVLGE
jgi:hypothetical protein